MGGDVMHDPLLRGRVEAVCQAHLEMEVRRKQG